MTSKIEEPAAAETAEREAALKRAQFRVEQYLTAWEAEPNNYLSGSHGRPNEVVASDFRTVLAGATWQREQSAHAGAWACQARISSLPEPQDCDWPVCGCDPYADKVIAALEEMGISREKLQQAAMAPAAEQSALSGGERAEVLRVLDLLIEEGDGWHETNIRAARDLAARLRSAPSEAELKKGGDAPEQSAQQKKHDAPENPSGHVDQAPVAQAGAAPSAAPERRAETPRVTRWERLSDSPPTFIFYMDDIPSEAEVDALLALPHPAPAADTVAVPRETLTKWSERFTQARCYNEAGEIETILEPK